MNGVYLGSMEATARVVASLSLRNLFVRGSLLLVLVLVLGVAVARIRRWYMAEESPADEPWTLQDLRDLHAAGKLSDEEFERLKSAMIAQVRPAPLTAGAETDLKNETADSTAE